MRLESLSLRGILRFSDPITLDFRDLPPGLIAVVGPNGAGKTTLMESPLACLYRQFPSRNREVFDYATGTDSFIETRFELEGRGLYRARLALDGPHRKAEATLAQILPDGRAVLLNDGKVSTYDPAVAAVLPRFEDLLASVFAAQNKVGSFSGLDKKGRRQLFASLLGLDHYEVWATRAREAATRVQGQIDRLSATRDALARDAGADVEASIDAEAQRLQVELGTVELRREELSRLIATAEQALSAVQAALATHAAAVAHRDRLDAEILATKATTGNYTDAIARAEQDATAELTRLEAGLQAVLTRLDAEAVDTRVLENDRRQIASARDTIIADATKRIDANKGLKAEGEAIRAAVARVTVLDGEIDEMQGRLRMVMDAIGALNEERHTLSQAYAAAVSALRDCERAGIAAALLDTVPCGGAGQYAACAFLSAATDAKPVAARVQEALAEVTRIEERDKELAARIESQKVAHRNLMADTGLVVDEQKRVKVVADKLPFLTQAETRIEELTAAIAEAERTATEALAAADVREQDRLARIVRDRANREEEYRGARTVVDVTLAERRATFTAQIERALAERVRLSAERDAVLCDIDATADAASTAATEQAKLTTYRAEWDASTRTLATVETKVADLERRRQALLDRRAELDRLDGDIEATHTDLIEWSVLAKAMGRDGLPTIEIDQAGPTVSAYANDLLQACFGGMLTLDLITQAPKTTKGKDGSTHKEVLDLLVYDQRRGGSPCAIEDLSGGERVIVEEVLRSAIALLVNQRNQLPLRTIWRDETLGALDPERAVQYIAMLRRLQELGGFSQVLFVCHSPDVALLADAQVRVDAGAFSIALPPFVDAEVLA